MKDKMEGQRGGGTESMTWIKITYDKSGGGGSLELFVIICWGFLNTKFNKSA